MAKKNTAPIITYTEIICLAIRSIDAEIATWQQRCEGLPEDYLERATEPLTAKRNALKQMFMFEVGKEYE